MEPHMGLSVRRTSCDPIRRGMIVSCMAGSVNRSPTDIVPIPNDVGDPDLPTDRQKVRSMGMASESEQR